MKRIFLLITALQLCLYSCKKVGDFDGLRPDDRLSEQLLEYQKQLTDAKSGWIGYLYPAGGGGYTFKFEFSDDNRVTMLASTNREFSTQSKESSYRLKATQVPSLYFDTYSYIHQLADPDPNQNGGSPGKGLLSDFEFSILKSSSDTLWLKGNLNESELILIRANQEQDNKFMAQSYAFKAQLNKLNTLAYYTNVLELNGKKYQVNINTDISTISFYYSKNGFQTFTTEYTTLDQGIVLKRPFIDDSNSIHLLTGFTFNGSNNEISVKVDGEKAATILNQKQFLVADPDAANNMYLETDGFQAPTGFTVNGKPDGFNLNALPNFRGVEFYPRFYLNDYDAFFAFFKNGNSYVGPALKTRIDTEGKLFFSDFLLQSNDAAGVPADAIVPLTNTLAQLGSESGFYVFKTGKHNYDLVSIKDSGIWLRFR